MFTGTGGASLTGGTHVTNVHQGLKGHEPQPKEKNPKEKNLSRDHWSCLGYEGSPR